MIWTKKVPRRKLELALENCYMMARRKRTIINRYWVNADGRSVAEPIGPKSADTDWDHIARFCEEAGIEMSIIRIQGKNDAERQV